MKKFISIIMALFFALTLFGCGGSKKESAVNSKNGKEYKIAYMTDTYGAEESFNKQVIEGINESFGNYEYSLDIYTPKTNTEYESMATSLLSAAQYDLVVSNSSAVCSALLAAQSEYSGSNLGFIGYNDETNNAMSVTFKNEEAAFLAGVLAALETKSNVGGYIGAYDDRDLDYEYGFLSGVKAVNSKIKVKKEYINSYMSAEEAEKKAEKLYNDKVDVVFTVCGAGAIGVNNVAKEKGFKVIDSDLYNKSDNEIKLAQINKDYKSAVISICDAVIFESYSKSCSDLGVLDSVIDLKLNQTFFDQSSNEYTTIEKVKKDMATKNLVIPTDEKSFKAFKYNIND